MTQLIDGVAGALRALLLLSLKVFRYLSLIVMPHTVMLLLGLLVVWAYLHWRSACAIVGGCDRGVCGVGGITRPLDALCYAIPVGIAILLDLSGRVAIAAGDDWDDCAGGGGAISHAATDHGQGVTGKFFETPYGLYASAIRRI